MPKITLTERQKDRERLAHNLQLLQRSRSYTCEEMGDIIGRSGPTYLSRLRNPDNLTFGEISSLCRYFKIEPERFVCGTLGVS